MKNLVLLLTVFVTLNAIGQSSNIFEKKSINVSRIDKSPTIDGILDETFWLVADEAKDFVMFRPGDGDKEKERRTIVKIAYDNEAIYFGATMYDPDPASIPTQFTSRDNIGNADFLLISLNPNNDGQNDTEFLVTSAGTQADAKITDDGEDWSWSSVWDSAVKINDEAWVVEMKIPYSALRFSNKNVQTWGLNIHRRIRNTNEQFVWNYIDKSSGLFTQFSGLIEGIENIKPPVRLSFSPYASASYATFDGEDEFNKSIGMDLKYGISEAFTLDATLIPDFGQTAFDEVVLNLGPFEQQYDEKRSFFTEGTELFEKGDLFYSRRVGNQPVGFWNAYDNLDENEEVVRNPHFVDMLNAVKVSGRTKKGLGIGFFNAITEKTSAKIKNTVNDEVRTITTEPFANYNVLVLDQQFNKTSSVTFVNANVMREGSFKDSNASSLLFNLTSKSGMYRAEGGAGFSSVHEFGSTTNGFFTDIELRKIGGNWQYGIEHHIQDDKYNKNDLGFQRRNNFSNFESYLSYQIFEPKGKFDSYSFSFWADLDYLYKPNKYTSNSIGLRHRFTLRNAKLYFGGMINGIIGHEYDYYEPRVTGRFHKKSGRFAINKWISTDGRKKLAIESSIFYAKRMNDDNSYINFRLSPRYRISDKFSINYTLRYSKDKNDKGFVNIINDEDIIFGKRDTKSLTNSISGNYNFNPKNALNLTFRYYWSPVEYENSFYLLNEDGLLDDSDYVANHDINYNVWNLDFSYSWEFAPGSQFVALYRNSLFKSDDLSDLKFKKNLEELFEEPMLHNFSVKFIYYLDYNKLRGKA